MARRNRVARELSRDLIYPELLLRSCDACARVSHGHISRPNNISSRQLYADATGHNRSYLRGTARTRATAESAIALNSSLPLLR